MENIKGFLFTKEMFEIIKDNNLNKIEMGVLITALSEYYFKGNNIELDSQKLNECFILIINSNSRIYK